MINNYAKGLAIQISTVLVPVHDAAPRSVLWNGNFNTFIKARFSEPVISEIHQLWGSSFYGKDLKFNVEFKNTKKKNSQNLSCFWDNCLCIASIKFFLLRREDLSRAVNALTNTFQTLHVSRRHFFEWKCLQSDQ